MAKNNLIKVSVFGQEIGTLGYDEKDEISFFQYNPDFLKSNRFTNIFPIPNVIKRTTQVQVFKKYSGETFRSIPPVFADSLPDMFGNIIFREWLELSKGRQKGVTVLEQLAYVSNRGMGALEYSPAIEIPKNSSIDINEIVDVVKKVLNLKGESRGRDLNEESLLNVFKIGSSAGGARPKILISENKQTKEIIPGDLNFSNDYNHYLVKLDIGDVPYSREVIEYCYYLTATSLGLTMMKSFLIEGKHFATTRFDRINGEKKHILTATGLTGWDFKSADVSTYENLFNLAIYLKIPHSQVEELFARMVFNVVFCNTDDHLKNHSFVYDSDNDSWNLSPLYDVTYSLNPLINYLRVSQALSINGKRSDISLEDIMTIADAFTIKEAQGYIKRSNEAIDFWSKTAQEQGVPSKVLERIKGDFRVI